MTTAVPTIRIHNTQTNEIVDRNMNDQELAQYKADESAKAEQDAAALASAAQKAALLIRLGLTEDELKTILG